MQDLKTILEEKQEKEGKGYIRHEFQDFGYRLAVELNDLKHKALYIKMAKEENRRLLKDALQFALDYPKARSRGKIFMWKLEQLKDEENKTSSNNQP